MAKKATKAEVECEMVAAFYGDDECFGVFHSVKEATDEATAEMADGCLEGTTVITICKLVPVRIVRQSEIVVEDL